MNTTYSLSQIYSSPFYQRQLHLKLQVKFTCIHHIQFLSQIKWLRYRVSLYDQCMLINYNSVMMTQSSMGSSGISLGSRLITSTGQSTCFDTYELTPATNILHNHQIIILIRLVTCNIVWGSKLLKIKYELYIVNK